MTSLTQAPGSFRDPAGTVYLEGGRVLRRLSPEGEKIWSDLTDSGLAESLMREKLLVSTRPADGEPATLEHEKIPFLSFIQEWPFHLLKKAALVHLDLMERLLPKGFILADGTPYNVQFKGTSPIFIDVLSLRKRVEGDPWSGYGQFCEFFLYPLLIRRYKGISHQPLMTGFPNGLPPEFVSSLFSWFNVLTPGVLAHVKLRALLHKKIQNPENMKREDIRKANLPASAIMNNVKSLRSTIESLTLPASGASHWTSYEETRTYDAGSLAKKKEAVEAALETVKPKTVWDLGCNQGEFSLMAAERAERVVSFDNDEEVVSALASRCEREGKANILPLVMDLTQPTPALGWGAEERPSLFQREKPDLTLALALVHHLAVKGKIPLPRQMATFAKMTRHLLVEYVDKEDSMFKRLRTNVEDSFEGYSRATFDQAAAENFSIVNKIEVSPTRTMYLLGPLGG